MPHPEPQPILEKRFCPKCGKKQVYERLYSTWIEERMPPRDAPISPRPKVYGVPKLPLPFGICSVCRSDESFRPILDPTPEKLQAEVNRRYREQEIEAQKAYKATHPDITEGLDLSAFASSRTRKRKNL